MVDAVLGTLSTVSHGFFLVFSAPVWIITSTVIWNNQTKTAVERYPDDFEWITLDAMRVYARFPQGLPENLDRTKLEQKDPSVFMKERQKRSSRRRR